MKSPIITTVSTPISADKLIFKPELIWPSICESGISNSDMLSVPTEMQIRGRKSFWDRDNKLLGSSAFIDAIANADEIRIIDPHIDVHVIKELREILRSSIYIKKLFILISGSSESEQISEIFNDLSSSLIDGGCKGLFYLKQSLNKYGYPFLHDRFALVDGELWHCGATVGGLYPGLNALSRGWDDNQHNFKDFFDLVWGRYS